MTTLNNLKVIDVSRGGKEKIVFNRAVQKEQPCETRFLESADRFSVYFTLFLLLRPTIEY